MFTSFSRVRRWSGRCPKIFSLCLLGLKGFHVNPVTSTHAGCCCWTFDWLTAYIVIHWLSKTALTHTKLQKLSFLLIKNKHLLCQFCTSISKAYLSCEMQDDLMQKCLSRVLCSLCVCVCLQYEFVVCWLPCMWLSSSWHPLSSSGIKGQTNPALGRMWSMLMFDNVHW